MNASDPFVEFYEKNKNQELIKCIMTPKYRVFIGQLPEYRNAKARSKCKHRYMHTVAVSVLPWTSED